jgi:hypothetical protein
MIHSPCAPSCVCRSGCGGCCDVRRATIIVNIVSAVQGVIGLIMLATVSTVATNLDASNYDDDEMKAAIAEREFLCLQCYNV